MNFEIVNKNITVDSSTNKALDKAIKRITRAVQGLKPDGHTSFITLKKYLKPEKYTVHMNIKVPGKMMAAHDSGYNIDEALHKTSEDLRDQIIKFKDRLKDFHERKRRAKLK